MESSCVSSANRSISMWHNVRNGALALVVACFAAFGQQGCSAAPGDPESEELVEDVASTTEGVSGSLGVGSQLKATGNVNLRATASTGGKILHVVPKGSLVVVQQAAPSNGF